MADQPHPSARRKIKILAVTALVGVVALGGLYAGWKGRKALMVRRALATGLAAYEQGDWETARLNLGRYISVHQDDADTLGKYAYAQLSVRPVKPEHLHQAMGAYRTILRLQPEHDQAFARLALLYEATGTLGELGHIAERRLDVRPDDPAAVIAQVKDLLFRERRDAARAALEGLVARLAEGQEACDEFVEACVMLAGLKGANDGPDAGPRAVDWLDQAVDRCPQSGWALIQRAARRQPLAGTPPGDAEEHRRPARADLERAEALGALEPRVRLLLSEQWMILQEYDRAAAQLEAARHATWAELETFLVDPADWSVALFVQNAKLALLTGDITGGVALTEQILEELGERPQRAGVLPIAVELFVAGGRSPEARRCLEDYVEALSLSGRLAPGDEQVAWLRAVVARGENKPYEVIEHLAPVAEQRGVRPAIQSLLAEAYMQTDQPARAARLFERIGVSAAAHPRLARLAAQVQVARGAWAEALGTLRTLEQSEGDSPEVAIMRLSAQLGLAYERGGPAAAEGIDAATRELHELRARFPDQVSVRLVLAAVAEQRNDLETAEDELKQAIEECTEPLAAYRALARLYAGSQRPDEARATLEQACRHHADRPAAWLALGDFLAGSQKTDEARTVLHRGLEALTAEPGRTALQQRLALLDLVEGERAAAIAALQELAAADPDDIRTRALLLELPEIAGEEAAAGALLEEIKRSEGASGVTWRIHEARLWLERRDWRARREPIEAHLKYCLDADPSLSAPVLLLGRMFEDLGDLASAETTYLNGFNRTGSLEAADRLLALFGRQRRFAEGRDLLQRMQQTLSAAAASTRRLALDIGEQRYDSALHELQMRTAGADRDPLDLVRLAWVSYAQNRDPDAALRVLDEAAAAGAAPLEVARVRTSILQNQGRHAEVEAVLDQLVAEHPTPDAFLLRASYRNSMGRTELAEQDYAALAQAAQSDFGPAVLGEFYAQSGQLDRAIQEWEAGLQAYPDSQVLSRGLAKAYLTRGQTGDRERADELLAELEQYLGDDADLIWVRAVEAAQLDTPESLARARELLRRAAQASPSRVEVYEGLCELAFGLGEVAVARDLAVRGLQANPGTESLLLAQARAELLLGRPDVARQHARFVLATNRENTAALLILLEVALRQQDTPSLREALARLEERIAADRTNDSLWILRAQTQMALGEADAAIESLAAFCATDAGRMSMPALLALQDLYRFTGDFAVAARTLDAAAAIEDHHPGVLHGRVLLLAAQGSFDDVVALMQTAQVEPQDADLLVSVANALAASPAHTEQAIALCQRAHELAPQNVNSLLALGDLEYQRGAALAAQQAYHACLALQPSHPAALNNLAWVLAESGTSLEEALSAARQAVSLQPTDANFRDTLAFVLRQSERLDEARAEYRRSIELTPPNSVQRARSLFHLAQVCAQLEDWEPVTAYLKEALAASEGRPIFAAEEQAEIQRLLAAAQQPQQRGPEVGGLSD
jgi:predicted Zn-dependent protease